MSLARRYSLCDDDASEALANGLEIAVRHRERIRPETAAAWFATVVRHEAMRIRERRCRELSLDASRHEPAPDKPEPARDPDPRLLELRAAMRQLQPDQHRALLLFYGMDRGDGSRYRRVMRATGWSYTKVNRCLTEGRAALRALLLDQPPDRDLAALNRHGGASPMVARDDQSHTRLGQSVRRLSSAPASKR